VDTTYDSDISFPPCSVWLRGSSSCRHATSIYPLKRSQLSRATIQIQSCTIQAFPFLAYITHSTIFFPHSISALRNHLGPRSLRRRRCIFVFLPIGTNIYRRDPCAHEEGLTPIIITWSSYPIAASRIHCIHLDWNMWILAPPPHSCASFLFPAVLFSSLLLLTSLDTFTLMTLIDTPPYLRRAFALLCCCSLCNLLIARTPSHTHTHILVFAN